MQKDRDFLALLQALLISFLATGYKGREIKTASMLEESSAIRRTCDKSKLNTNSNKNNVIDSSPQTSNLVPSKAKTLQPSFCATIELGIKKLETSDKFELRRKIKGTLLNNFEPDLISIDDLSSSKKIKLIVHVNSFNEDDHEYVVKKLEKILPGVIKPFINNSKD